VDWILDRVAEVPEVDAVHVVTNAHTAPAFLAWARGREVVVPADGTVSNDDRLGAIGDLQFVLGRTHIDDDLLVIAGDNLFEFSLCEYVDYWSGKGRASAVAVHDVGSLELASSYGIVSLDTSGRVVDFVEKPARPPSTLAATATYVFHRAHVPLVSVYLAGGNPADQPGRFVAWLYRREPVYGWVFEASWHDIGSPAQLLEADNLLRERQGLPHRDAYSPD
jgi:glucose-1-phosphate thymidylyltransferase